MRLRSNLLVFLSIALPELGLLAREIPQTCGTERFQAAEEVFLHRRSVRSGNKGLARRAAEGPAGKTVGNIAVLYDSGGIVARRNPFSLSLKTITFQPGPGFDRYRFSLGEDTFDAAASAEGTQLARLQDDDTRRAVLPFEFPFFGQSYTAVWVNSDGNLTFGEGDTQTSARSIGQMNGGPPRIAPLYLDLDPTRSATGVRVRSEAGRVVITWQDVPPFSGVRAPQTFQVRLYPDGRIEFAYRTITATDLAVGISPGRTQSFPELVSFIEGSGREFTGTVAERFATTDAIDSVLLSQRFYQLYDDSYDYLAVYNTLGIPARAFAVATQTTVRSTDRAGFGDTVVDSGTQYGSRNRLQAFLNMGSLTQYPRDPYALVPSRAVSGDTPVSILLHETGHLFLALASVRDEVDPALRPMLGSAQAHWSFNFNSEASFVEGNRIQDDGENANPRFTTTATAEQYSPLDQYLMGFRAPEEVPPMFLVRNAPRSNNDPPQRGVRFNGERRDVTIGEIIAAEGRRSPDHTVAQRRYRMAIVLVVREGSEPAAEDIAQLERLRTEFETAYTRSTGNRAAMDAALQASVRLSTWPAVGMVQGFTIDGKVTVDRPVDADLTVLLETARGVAAASQAVAIPAGMTEAAFSLHGERPGVEELTAVPQGGGYRGDHARIAVAESPGAITLAVTETVLEDNLREIVVRATDANLIAYPGWSLTAAAGGEVSPQTGITGADGTVRFWWSPGPQGGKLTVTLDGTETSATVSAEPR